MTSADAILVVRAVCDALGEIPLTSEGRPPDGGQWWKANPKAIDADKFATDLEYELERIGFEIRRKP